MRPSVFGNGSAGRRSQKKKASSPIVWSVGGNLIRLSWRQFAKHPFPMAMASEGRSTNRSVSQSLNRFAGRAVGRGPRRLGKVIRVSLVFAKAPSPSSSSVSGNLIRRSALPLKASRPMLRRLGGSTIFSKDTQSLKALSPISSNCVGNASCVRERHPSKVPAGSDVMLSGN